MRGYIKTKQEFLKAKNQDIINSLKKEFIGDDPPIKAWEKLISDIKKSKKFNELPDDVVLGMECACATGGMSIDLLIAFVDKSDNKHALIVEAKNWSDEYVKSLSFSDNRRRDNTLHPQIQANRQFISFKNYTDIGNQYSVTPYVYIKCSKSGIEEIINNNPDEGSKGVKITNNLDDIFEVVKKCASQILGGIQKFTFKNELVEASYQMSTAVTEAMHSVISKTPELILTDNQRSVLDNILQSIKGGKRFIRITGGAGTGKTAILIGLYLELLKQQDAKLRPILVTGAYNTDYYRSIFPESESVFEFSHALERIINADKKQKFVVLMDEAQHNDKGEISKLVRTNAILVVCYDETQAIRASNCIEELIGLESRSDFISLKLTESMRYNGSKCAEQNVKNFLDGKKIVKDELFDFQVCTSFQDFQTKLRALIENNPQSTVATVGLLCNDDSAYTYPKNRNSILKTRWYDKAECDWMEYVKKRNYLKSASDKIWVGTWWMQGLDVDYVAVIVGDDGILTDDGFEADWHKTALYQTVISVAKKMYLPENLSCKEPKDYAKKIISHIDNSKDGQLKLEFAVTLAEYIKNYYYILLTRGRKGCLVYFANNKRTDKSQK